MTQILGSWIVKSGYCSGTHLLGVIYWLIRPRRFSFIRVMCKWRETSCNCSHYCSGVSCVSVCGPQTLRRMLPVYGQAVKYISFLGCDVCIISLSFCTSLSFKYEQNPNFLNKIKIILALDINGGGLTWIWVAARLTLQLRKEEKAIKHQGMITGHSGCFVDPFSHCFRVEFLESHFLAFLPASCLAQMAAANFLCSFSSAIGQTSPSGSFLGTLAHFSETHSLFQ